MRPSGGVARVFFFPEGGFVSRYTLRRRAKQGGVWVWLVVGK